MKTVASQSRVWKDNAFQVKVAGLGFLVAITFAACASTPKTLYYTLRVPASPSAPSPKTEFVLQVERFDAPDLLRDNRLIYYKSPTELNFYTYRRWSSGPADQMTELALKFFAETGLFKQVYTYPSPVHADYTLRGRVLNLAEIEYEKSGRKGLGEGKVGLKLDLIQTNANKVVWSARLQEAAPIEKKNSQAVVDALNNAAGQVMQKAYAGISQVVEHAEKQDQGH